MAQAGGKLPKCPGLYLLRSDTERLFTGRTANLQVHFDCMLASGGRLRDPFVAARQPCPGQDDRVLPLHTETPDILLAEFWRANLRYKLPWLNHNEEELAA